MPRVLKYRSGVFAFSVLVPVSSVFAGVAPTCTPVWAQLNPDTSPSPRFATVMATNGNDAIMFGGLGQNGITGDLWKWDGSNWTLITTSAAFARSNAAAVTVIPPGGGPPSTLVFGGVNPSFAPLGDLLTWSPATGLISLTSDLGLGARFNHGWCGAIDQNFNNLLIGGGDCAGVFATGHRVTLGGNIAVLPPDSPANFYQRSNFASAWDSLRGRAVIIGGSSGTSPCFAPVYDATVRTWSPVDGWDSLSGVPDFLTSNHVAAFSPQDALVVFGGETQGYPSPIGLKNSTNISFDGGTLWSPVAGPSPSPRRAVNNMVWVPGAEHFVLFGGHDGGGSNSGFLGDTWVLSYRPVLTSSPANVERCRTQTATFRAQFALPNPATQRWSFRWFDANTGFDSGWIDRPQAAACQTDFNLIINGRSVARILNVCSELVSVIPGPDLAAADRIRARCTASTPCAASVTSAEAEVTYIPDFNSDEAVNTADLVFFLARFGQTGPTTGPYNPADLNGDGSVNTADLVFFLGRFGRSCD